jgi:hypothetical protein
MSPMATNPMFIYEAGVSLYSGHIISDNYHIIFITKLGNFKRMNIRPQYLYISSNKKLNKLYNISGINIILCQFLLYIFKRITISLTSSRLNRDDINDIVIPKNAPHFYNSMNLCVIIYII